MGLEETVYGRVVLVVNLSPSVSLRQVKLPPSEKYAHATITRMIRQ